VEETNAPWLGSYFFRQFNLYQVVQSLAQRRYHYCARVFFTVDLYQVIQSLAQRRYHYCARVFCTVGCE
jgi:hypothetical protein